MWNILWIEDDIFQLKSLLLQIEVQGHSVTRVPLISDAHDMIVENGIDHYDLIIVDLLLPSDDRFGESPEWVNRFPRPKDDAFGVVLIKHLRQDLGVSCPILVLSIVSAPINEFDLANFRPIEFVIKRDVKPSEIATAINDYMQREGKLP